MDFTKGTHRDLVATTDADALRRNGTLVADSRRERPRWFDGRFLAARDLIREQQYFLTREADLGRAAGSGVATGLAVTRGEGARTLDIAAGHGVTPSGELVMLQNGLTLDLSDIPRMEQLSAKFGLGRMPLPPPRSRSGLFALALRPVEYTANPIGAYPTSLTGARTVEDGDIIEATAVVLVPWPASGGNPGSGGDGDEDTLDLRRGRAARAIFVDGSDRGLPTDLLPLAMLALDNNTVAWIDMPMLRRELGADRDDLPGLGLAPRALRFAHLLQHQQQLADVLAGNGGQGFTAASVFPALPPAGPLPPGVIDPQDFSQNYFPGEIEVDFSIIPEDELPALVEEALSLPAFDLSDEAALQASGVLVLAPVPRNQWREVQAKLLEENHAEESEAGEGGIGDAVVGPRALIRRLRPAAPSQIAARTPFERLMWLRLPRFPVPRPQPPASEWRRLAQSSALWFVRRRNLAYREDLTGTALRLAGRERVIGDDLRDRLRELDLATLLEGSLERATPAARLEITSLLSTPSIAASPAMLAATLGELSRAEELDQAAALRVTGVLTAPEAGLGLRRLDAAGIADRPEVLERLTGEDWRAIDRGARVVPRDVLPDLDRVIDLPLRPLSPSGPLSPTPLPPAPLPPVGGARKTTSKTATKKLTRKAAGKTAEKKTTKATRKPRKSRRRKEERT